MNRVISEAIQKLAKTFQSDGLSFVVCTVDSVDTTSQTCDCTPVSGNSTAKIPSVSLKAEPNDGLLLIPKVDSVVIVALSQKNTGYVALFSDLDSLEMVVFNGTQKSSLKISQGLTQFNDGGFGGLTKTLELKTQINKLNAQLQAVITALTTWAPVPGDGGAALKAAAIAGMAGKPAGDFSGIENPLVKHGS